MAQVHKIDVDWAIHRLNPKAKWLRFSTYDYEPTSDEWKAYVKTLSGDQRAVAEFLSGNALAHIGRPVARMVALLNGG